MEPRSSESYLASDDANYWRYEVAPANTKVTLKNIGGVQATGMWDGVYGFAFVAWAPLIKADKDKEELLKQHGWKKPWSQLVAEGLAPAEPAPTGEPGIVYQVRDDRSAITWRDTDHAHYLQAIQTGREVRTVVIADNFATGGPVPAPAGLYRVGEQPAPRRPEPPPLRQVREDNRPARASSVLAAPYGDNQGRQGPDMYAQAATEIIERTSRSGCDVDMTVVGTCSKGTYGCKNPDHNQ